MRWRQYNLKIAALFIGLLFFCVIGGSRVSAIDGESIVMSPATKPLKLDAGEVLKSTFTIINDGTVGYSFKVYAAPYSVKDHSYEANYTAELPNTDVYRWVAFAESEYHLEPGERVDVPYTVTVPSDAAPGGHYGVLFAETQPRLADQSQITRKKRVGAIVYATIKGDYITAGQAIQAKIDAVQIGYPLRALMVAENTGNTDFQMKKTIRVKSIFGAKLYEKTDEHILLPKTVRDLQLQWDNGAWLGWYNVHIESVILGTTTERDQLVFIAPAWFIIVLGGVVLVVMTLVVRRVRR